MIILLGSRVRQSTKSLLHCTNKTIYLVTLIVLAWDVSMFLTHFMELQGCGIIQAAWLWNDKLISSFPTYRTSNFSRGSMSSFHSSTVQAADAWLTKTPFKKKNGVPETVPETNRNENNVQQSLWWYRKLIQCCHAG